MPKDFDVFEPGVTFSLKLPSEKDLQTITKFLDAMFTVPIDKNYDNIIYLKDSD